MGEPVLIPVTEIDSYPIIDKNTREKLYSHINDGTYYHIPILNITYTLEIETQGIVTTFTDEQKNIMSNDPCVILNFIYEDSIISTFFLKKAFTTMSHNDGNTVIFTYDKADYTYNSDTSTATVDTITTKSAVYQISANKLTL